MIQWVKSNWKRKAVYIPAIIFVSMFVGFLFGAGEPEVVTETKTETKVVEKKVEVTPKSCIKALDYAEAIITGPAARTALRSVDLVNLIPLAFEAGSTYDESLVNQITNELDNITAATEADTSELEENLEQYNLNAAKCRG